LNKSDTMKVLAVLEVSYPQHFKSLSQVQKNNMVNLWTKLFQHDNYKIVITAVEHHIMNDTKGFFPVIGAIREMMYQLNNLNEITEQEAWNIIRKAISNSYTVRESFEAMPPLVKRIVGSASQLGSWALMDLNTVNSVVSSNFQRSYKALAAKQKGIVKINPMLTTNNTKLLEVD